MSAIERKDIIDPDALSAPGILTAELEKLLLVMKKVISSGLESAKAVDSSKSTMRVRQETEKLSAEQKELIKVQQQIARANAKNNAEYAQQAKALRLIQAQVRDKATADERAAKAVAKTAAAELQAAEAAKKLREEQEKALNVTRELNSLEEIEHALNVNRVAWAKLTTEQERNSEAGIKLKEIINEQAQAQKDLRAGLMQYFPSIGNYTDAILEAQKRIELQRRETENLIEAQKTLDKTTENGARAAHQLDKAIEEATRSLNEMEKEAGQAETSLESLKKQINETDKAADGFSLEGTLEAVGTIAPGVTGSLKAVTSSLGSVKVGILGVAAGAVALGKAFYDESVRIKKNLETVNSLTGLTGLELQNFTAKAGATSKVFDKEFNETIKAGNVVMKAFGVTGEESFNQINQLLLRGVDINGDFLEQISEYSTFVSQAGGSTQDLVDILLASEQAGVFSDKGLDTVKEFTLRIREMTTSTSDAIKGLGLSVTDIEKGLRDGSLSVMDVLKQITNRMDELPPISREVGTAIADIFGGPGEDAGQFLMQLGKINKTQGDWTKSLTGSYKAQYDLLQATQEYETVLISTAGNFNAFGTRFDTFLAKVKTEGLKILADLADMFTTVRERVDEYQKTIATTNEEGLLVREIGNLNTELQKLEDNYKKVVAGADMNNAADRKRVAELRRQYTQTDAYLEVTEKITIAELRLNKLRDERSKKTQKEAEDTAKVTSELAKKMRDAEFELQKFRIEQAIKAQEEIRDTEGKLVTERIEASLAAERLRVRLSKLIRDHELEEEGLTQAQITLIHEKYNAEILDNYKKSSQERRLLSIQDLEYISGLYSALASNENKSFEDRIDALNSFMDLREEILMRQLQAGLITEKQYQDAVVALTEDTTDKIVALMLERQQKVAQVQNNKAGTQNNDELRELNEQYAAQEISTKDFLKRRQELQDSYRKRELEAQLEFYQEQVEMLKKAGIDTTAQELEISAIKLELSQGTADKQLEIETALQEALHELDVVSRESAMTLIDNFNEAADMKRAEQMEKLTAQRDLDLKLAGDNEAAKQEIKNKYDLESEKLRKKQAAADRKRAVFEKAITATQIAIQTALAVSKALASSPPPASFVLAAVTAAVGAVQLAAVLSKPIPSYAVGTDNHPGGLALVGERGHELVTTPDGGMFLTPNTDTLMDLPARSKVMTNPDTMRTLAMAGIKTPDSTMVGIDLRKDLSVVSDEIRDLHHTLKRKEMTVIIKSDASRQESLKTFYK